VVVVVFVVGCYCFLMILMDEQVQSLTPNKTIDVLLVLLLLWLSLFLLLDVIVS